MLDTLDEYMRELELMEKQYGQEEELYPLINIMLRKWGNLKGCSIRAVNDGEIARKAKNGKDIFGKVYLGGYCSFPDIAILGEEFNTYKKDAIKYIYGCVEVKALGDPLLNIVDGEKMKMKIEDAKILILKPYSTSARYEYRFTIDEKNNDKIKKSYSVGNDDISVLSKLVGKNIKAMSDKDWEAHCVNKNNVGKRFMTDFIKGEDNRFYVSIAKGIKVTISEPKLSDDQDDPALSDNPDDPAVMELIGELLWYGKVLYTNGIQWKEISILEVNGKYDDDNENLKKEGKDIKNIIDLRNAIDKDVESKISEIKDEIKKIQNSTDLTQEEIKKKINEKNKQIKDIYKNYNILEKCKRLKIIVTCKTIATLFDYDVEKDVHPSSSEEEWRKLITYFVNMSWKPTEDETEKDNLNADKETAEAMYNYNLSENQNEEMERELTLSEYIDELDIPEDVLETNVFEL